MDPNTIVQNSNLAVSPQLQQALASYGVDVANVVEAHPQVFRDYQVYPALGALNFTFFQNQPGNGGADEFSSNMQGNGSFPAGQNFLWTTTEILFLSGQKVSAQGAVAAGLGVSAVDDYNAVMFGAGRYRFLINTKEYLEEGPLAALPCGFGQAAGLGVADDNAAVTAVAAQGWPIGDVRRTSGQLITSNKKIMGKISFKALIPTPSTIAGILGVRIGGIWYQLAQ